MGCFGVLISRLAVGDGEKGGEIQPTAWGSRGRRPKKEKGDREMARYAAKVDKNQKEIVAALRQAGCSVFVTSGWLS